MMTSLFRSAVFRRALAGFFALLLALALTVFFFPWDSLRGSVNRHVSEQLGRRFEITQHLAVDLGLTTTVHAEGLELANPEWASEPFLLKAKAAEFEVKLLPLLVGKVVLPRIALTQAQIGLQIEPDGRRTWALSRDTSDESAAPEIGALLVDQGTVKYRAAERGANLVVQFSLSQESASPLPLSYQATGRWKNEPFSAKGRTAGVLQMSRNAEAPFPMEIDAVAGRTRFKAEGSIANLEGLSGVDATFDLQGQNLEELYRLLGVVLPSTPPYRLRGRLNKHGQVWAATQIQGVLGTSDLSGALSFDTSAAVPLLTGKVQSKRLDFADLAPLIGMAPVTAASKQATASAAAGKDKASFAPVEPPPVRPLVTRKVLPTATLDMTRLKSMNADVTYSAADIRHIEVLPLDQGRVHVKLQAGVLQLDPVSLGVAGGSVAGSISIDANVSPAAFNTRLAVRGLQLNQLFPAVETTKTGFGKVSGQLDLKGRGNSVAQMLGAASGNFAVLMGSGEISNILLEYMGLDGGEVIKFFLRGDRNVGLRCAAAAFDVNQGLMTSRVMVLDTTDTLITGRGQVSLASETLDIVLAPAPKDWSILSLRSPLRIGGTFASPSAGPDKAALAGRAGIAIALAAINPLLALAATIETGPGQDADCSAALALAAKSGAAANRK